MMYLLHAGLLLAGCFGYYWLILRGETHFALNRWVLLACLVGSLTLPLITVPAGWSFREAFAEEITPAEPMPSDLAIAAPVATREESQIPSTTAPSIPEGSKIDVPTEPLYASTLPFDWRKALFWLYLVGVLIFGANFLLQLGQIVYRVFRYPGHDLGEFHLVEMREDEAPFSFWNRIFLNPDRYDPETYHQIVQHEQIHVNQRHSLDLLLAEGVLILQWFNPFAWFYRAAIEHNLEYLTDAEMLRGGNDPEAYQLSLVKVAVPNFPNGLVASYNQNFLEKRITMMKTRKSSLRSGWKYFTLLPLLFLSVLQFNAVAQSTPDARWPEATATPLPTETTDCFPIALGLEVTTDIPAPLSEVAPDPATAPTPVFAPTSEHSPQPFPDPSAAPGSVSDPLPLPADGKDINSWTALIEGKEICFQFMTRGRTSGHSYNSNYSRCFGTNQFGNLPRNSMGEFSLTRATGTMTFKGIFEGNDGVGNFTFSPSANFASQLRSDGYGTFDDREMMLLFMADMNDDYLNYLKSTNYEVGHSELIELAIFYKNLAELKGRVAWLKENGFEDTSLKRVIELQIHGVNDQFAQEMVESGFRDLSIQDLIDARIHGMSGRYLEGMARSGFAELEFSEAKQMSIHGIDPDYVKEMNLLGYDNLSSKDIVQAKIHGLSARKVMEYQQAGLDNLSLEEARNLTIHGVDAKFIATLKEFGFTNLSPREVTNAKIHGLSEDKLRAFKSTGLPITDLREVQNASIHGVTAQYVAGMRAVGYKDLELADFVKARIHGITPEWAASFREVGYKDIPMRTLVDLRIHGVTPEFIKARYNEEYDLKQYIKLKMHGL